MIYPISCVNWPDQFPFAPKVTADVTNHNDSLRILFTVEGERPRAIHTCDQDDVYQDSCVEFFVMNPEGKYYFNFEFNAIGVCHAAARLERDNILHRFTPEELAQIVRRPSLGKEPFDTLPEPTKWTLEVEIPWKLMEYPSAPKEILGNLYKCGDKTCTMHFVSAFPIALPKPNFHCPDYFQPIQING